MPDTSLWRRLHTRATLLSGWTWVAAASLIGFEALDIVFGAFILAPELLPLALIALAAAWLLRERIRRASGRLRLLLRIARRRRATAPSYDRRRRRDAPRSAARRG